eukprot:jgi/Chlat1/947/Chrsp108S01377
MSGTMCMALLAPPSSAVRKPLAGGAGPLPERRSFTAPKRRPQPRAAPICVASSSQPSEQPEQQREPRASLLHVLGRDWQQAASRTAATALIAAAIAFAPTAQAADVLKTCTCLLKECRAEFTRCLGDVKCAANIACLQTCNDRPDETECQIKCGDLFENKVVDEFNKCAVSDKKCVPQKPDENLYPVPPPTALVPEFDMSKFNGKWYISSGQNPTFDVFDCQLHEFNPEENNPAVVGNLTWRIDTPDGGFFTRSAVQRFVQDPSRPGVLYNHNNEFLHYEDDWYIIGSQTEGKPDDYIFVYYKGRNDAWDGYGGAVVYTRSKTVPDSVRPALREQAKNVGLDYDKFIETDNSCKPQLPFFIRFGKKIAMELEKDEQLLVRELEKEEKAIVALFTDEEKALLEKFGMSAAQVEDLFSRPQPVRKLR